MNYVNYLKKFKVKFLLFYLFVLFIFLSFYFFKFDDKNKVLSEDNTVDYGITYVNLDDFAYYEIPSTTINTSTREYHWWGASLDIKWSLPAEAKEGDYFTLNFPEDILLDSVPMYKDDETVPYDKLDSLADSDSKIFFRIVTEKTKETPEDIPIMNVYYTKSGELTFVVQRYVNDKGPISGTSIIGKRIDKNKLVAYTDTEGRHYKDNYSNSYIKNIPQKNDLLEKIQRYDFYEGFRPNKFTLKKGAVGVSEDVNKSLKKTLTFTVNKNAKIGTENLGKEKTINDDVRINYNTELWKCFIPNCFGESTIYPVKEDENYIYYHFIYNANGEFGRSAARNIYLNLLDKSMELENLNDIKLYKADKESNPISMVPNIPNYPNNANTSKKFEGKGGYYSFSLRGSETTDVYFADIKLRKKKLVKDNEEKLAYKVSINVNDGIWTRETDDFYHPTKAIGSGRVENSTSPYVLTPPFRVFKVDGTKKVVEPTIEQKDGKNVLYDNHGLEYTKESDGKYKDNKGRIVVIKKKDGKEIFEGFLGKLFYKNTDGTFTDVDGFIYKKQNVNGKEVYKASEETKSTGFKLKHTNNQGEGHVFTADGEVMENYDFNPITREYFFRDTKNNYYVLTFNYDSQNVLTDIETIRFNGVVVQYTKTKTGTTEELDCKIILNSDKEFLPTRPVIMVGETTLTKTIENGKLGFKDEIGEKLKFLKLEGNEFSFEDRFSNVYVFDNSKGKFLKYNNTEITDNSNGDSHTISNMDSTGTIIKPKIKDPFEFKVTDKATGEVYTHKVDESGFVRFPSLMLGHSYTLEEVSTTEGYIAVTEKFTITVGKDKKITVTDEKGVPVSDITKPMSSIKDNETSFSLINNKKSQFRIRKVDSEDKVISTGEATFELSRDNKKVEIKTKINENEFGFSEYVAIAETWENPVGDYVLKEISAPTNFKKFEEEIKLTHKQTSDNKFVWELKADNSENVKSYVKIEDDGVTLSFKNLPDKFDLRILKRDKVQVDKLLEKNPTLKDDKIFDKENTIPETEEPFKVLKAKFKLVKEEDTSFVKDGYTDDENGSLLFNELKSGKYKLIEIEAPKNYQILNGEYSFTITEDGKIQADVNQDINNKVVKIDLHSGNKLSLIVKNPKLGKFVIDKFDKADNKKLDGVTFTLYQDESCKNPVMKENKPYSVVTKDGGQAVFDNLKSGTYYLKESSALKDYKPSDKVWKIVVNDEGKTLVGEVQKNNNVNSSTLNLVEKKEEILRAFNVNSIAKFEYNPVIRDISQPNYRQDTNGDTITKDDITLKQNITEVSQGYYKVDVEASGKGLINQKPKTKVTVFLEARSSVYMWGNSAFYKARLLGFLDELRKTLPDADFDLIVHNADTNETLVSSTDINSAYNSLNSVQTTGKNGTEIFSKITSTKKGFEWSIRDYKYLSDDLNKLDYNKRNVIINIDGSGLYPEWEDQNYEYTYQNNSVFYFYEKKLKEVLSKQNTEHFAIIESINDYYNVSRIDLSERYKKIPGVKPENIILLTNSLKEQSSNTNNANFFVASYNENLKSIARKIGNDSGNFEISLADNVLFDSTKGTSGIENLNISGNLEGLSVTYNANTNKIEGKNLKFTPDGNPSIKFSYYVHSNSEDSKAVFDTFEHINIDSKFIVKENEKVEYKFPTPEVKIPFVEVSLERKWENVPENKKTSTSIALLADGKEITNILYKDGNEKFKKVPKFDNKGKDIIYTIREDGLNKEFESLISYSKDGGIVGIDGRAFILTKYAPITLKAKKIWKDTEDKDKETVFLKLVAKVDGKEIDVKILGIIGEVFTQDGKYIKKLGENENWKTEFTGLPKYYKESENSYKLIEYSVVEVSENGNDVNENIFDVEYVNNNLDSTVFNRKNPIIPVENEKVKDFTLIIKKRDEKEIEKNKNLTDFNLVDEDDKVEGTTKFYTMLDASFELLNEKGESFNPKREYKTEKGKVSIENIKTGSYELKEIISPNGYKKLDRNIKFTIDENGKIKENESFSKAIVFDSNDKNEIGIIVKNEKIESSFILKVLKRDFDSNEQTPLNAKFELYRANRLDGKVVADESKKIGEGFTFDGNDGLLFKSTEGNEITKGDYVLREVVAPKGFAKLNSDISFSIDKDGNITLETDDETVTKLVIVQKTEEKEDDKIVLEINVKNKKTIYPSTGGIGSLIFVLIGIFVVAMSFTFYKKRIKY